MSKNRGIEATLVGLRAMAFAGLLTLAQPASAQTELATLYAGDAALSDNFGASVAVSGNWAIVGAPLWDGVNVNEGAVYFFELTGTWTQVGGAVNPGTLGGDDRFGASVAIDGDVAVVGAPQHNNVAGAVWVYRHNGFAWIEEDMLLGAAMNDRFGDSVAIEGGRIVVGASQANSGNGLVYVFDYNGSNDWTPVTTLAATSPAMGNQFGCSVAISGSKVVVGARGVNNNTGAAFVFDSAAWGSPTIITAPAGAINDQFGSGVAISGNTVAVGAPGYPSGLSFSGAVYVFDGGGPWSLTTLLDIAFNGEEASLGFRVAMDGNRIAAGAPTWGGSGAGATALYQRNAGVWGEEPLSPVYGGVGDTFTSITLDGDQVGSSVAIDGDIVFTGSPGHDNLDFEDGSVLVFQAAPLTGGGTDTDEDGVDDADELLLANGGPCPDPDNPDSDGDGLSDGDENFIHNTNMCLADTDGDGLSDSAEINTHGTDPADADSDGDTLLDGVEVGLGSDPNDTDTDDDGLGDAGEASGMCPFPNNPDSDGDGLNDGLEMNGGWSPCLEDSDGDTLSDAFEYAQGTCPNDVDSDDDNLNDNLETVGSCPDALDPDSDDDGIEDGDEIVGCGPCDPSIDVDNDGLCSAAEAIAGTNPNDPDSDDDGLLDGAEIASGCTGALVPDSDGDTLLDGAEVSSNPCDADSDDDGLADNIDPNPMAPDSQQTVLAVLTLVTAGSVADTNADQFLGPNTNVQQVRRTLLSAQLVLAAVAINNGNYDAAQALLTIIESRVDGVSPPPDWMSDGSDKSMIHSDVEALLVMLDMIS